MSFTVRRFTSSIEGNLNGYDLSSHLQNEGYTPIIMEAKQRFANVYSESGLIDYEESDIGSLNRIDIEPLIEQRLILGGFSRLPVAGDIIYKEESEGILYFLLSLSEEEAMRIAPDFEMDDTTLGFEIGYIGGDSGLSILEDFKTVIEDYCFSGDNDGVWESVTYQNEEFGSLEESDDTTFMPASNVTSDDIKLSGVLESKHARELSIKIKRGGGLLNSDIQRENNGEDGNNDVIEELVDNGLLSTEHVIICKQTSNQVNRVPDKESLDKLEEIGVQCSCGRPISEERHEKLYVPTEDLNEMITQSYWMTARLVNSLRNIGISDNDILLNFIDGSDEVDAFVDIEGDLVMIELKDSEFSMGHAYAFGGRIAQYKPSYAMIVSTRGVDEEVKEYFERVKPEADLTYVDSLDELDSSINDIASEVRSNKAAGIIDALESTSSVSVPIRKSISEKMGVSFPDKRSRRGSHHFISG